MAFHDNMDSWTPADSDILHARNMGMTTSSANKYMGAHAEGLTAGRRAGAYDRAVQDQDQREDNLDLLHLRKDLAYAGYSGAHDFTFNNNGNWTFNESVWPQSRNKRQLAQLDFLRSQVGSEALDEAVMSRLENASGKENFNLRSLINDMHTEVKENVRSQREEKGTETLVTANDFWEAYGFIN